MNQTYTRESNLDLLLFTVEPDQIIEAENAGISGIIVDWENHGKKARQHKFDTQINSHDFEDLCRVRRTAKNIKVICRINGFSDELSYAEIDKAVAGGAQEIFLPMVKSAEEVAKVLDHLNDRAEMSILVETLESLRCLEHLARLPLNRVYIGLNDLHIQQKSRNLFQPLINDIVSHIRSAFEIPVGVGGVTAPSSGAPIKSELLIKEYARLNIDFSFLRRTFLKDCRSFSMKHMVEQVQTAYKHAAERTDEQKNDDFRLFESLVSSWNPNLSYA